MPSEETAIMEQKIFQDIIQENFPEMTSNLYTESMNGYLEKLTQKNQLQEIVQEVY